MTQTRFPLFDQAKLFLQWLTGWGGKYTADYMRNNPASTLDDLTSVGPIGTYLPSFNAPDNVIQSWFGTVSSPPYDMALITRTTVGSFQDYQTWRYRADGGGTYTMFQQQVHGIIAKQYKIGPNGKIDFLNQYIIGTPVEFVE